MKKTLVSLFVLVLLATLLCGTACAASSSMEKNGYSISFVSMSVRNIDTGIVENESVPVGVWTIVGRCYFATDNGHTYYPESASVQKVSFSPYIGGDSGSVRAQYSTSTSEQFENGKRVQVTLRYSCPVTVRHRSSAAKTNEDKNYTTYRYSTTSTSTDLQSSTSIYFYKYN